MGASRDLYSSNNGKLTGEAFVTRDLNLGANGAGGNLKWNSDRLQGQLEAQKFRGYNPVVSLI